MTEAILFICIVVQAIALIWAQNKIDELKMRNSFLKSENDSFRLFVGGSIPKGARVYRVPVGDDGTESFPPYMSYPRKSSVNVCAGCVHEATNKGSFPCDKCKRMLRSEHDMFVKKVEE